MLRSFAKLGSVALLAAAGSVGVYVYQSQNSIQRQLLQEQQRTQELKLIVQRLTAERRVADVMVTDQQTQNGTLRTTLVFVEYARDGSPLPGKHFTIEGKTAHIDAMVVKFDGKFVEQNDPLRGRSIALFTNFYGEHQTPANGFRIDEPGGIPEIYRGATPQVSSFERELWQNFWKLADDPTYRESMGVRIAQGEGVWRPFEPDTLYTLTLESNGGLNISAEPLKGIYREAMKHHAAGN